MQCRLVQMLAKSKYKTIRKAAAGSTCSDVDRLSLKAIGLVRLQSLLSLSVYLSVCRRRTLSSRHQFVMPAATRRPTNPRHSVVINRQTFANTPTRAVLSLGTGRTYTQP